MKLMLSNINRDAVLPLLKKQWLWAAAIVVLAVALGNPPPQKAVIWPDSGSYLGMSTARMPVFPLIAAWLGYGTAFVWFHFLISVAAWCWLGWVVTRAVGVLIGACIAVSGPIIMWNMTVLSESVCLSLMAALLAATILLFRHWSWWRFGVWCALGLLFALTRTSNMFLMPFLVIPFVPSGRKRLLWVVLAAVAVMIAADTYSRTRGASLRRTSLINVYTARLLRNDDSREFLSGHGMPLTRDMEPFINKTGIKNAEAMFEANPDFAQWFEARGNATYLKWLLSQPYNYVAPAASLRMNLDFLNLQYAEKTQVRDLSVIALWIYDHFFAPWWIWIFGLLLPLASWRVYGRVTPESLFVVALMLAIYGQAYVGLHGDRAEISRHMLVALVLYRITLWLILLSVITLFLEWRRRRPSPAAGEPAKARTPQKKRAKRKRR
jgi:hypothetical protein